MGSVLGAAEAAGGNSFATWMASGVGALRCGASGPWGI